MTSAGAEAVDLAATAGMFLDTAQCRVLSGALGQRSDGQWSAREVGLVVPRQNMKTIVVEVAMLAAAYLQQSKVVYTAHLMATSRKIREHIQQLIESSPDLDREVKQIRVSNEEQSIELKSRARIDFAARSGSTARGWSGYDMVVLDEAFALLVAHVGALLPIMFARAHWQLWYASSAGKPDSHALRQVRARGIDKDPGLAYYEWSVPEEVYRAAPEYVANMPAALAQANPALGTRIALETLARAQRSMDAVEFAREVLGVWDDPRGEPLIDLALWARLVDPFSQIHGGMVFALDASPGLASGAIGVAGYRDDDLAHVEITGRDGVLDHRPGVDWMVRRVVELDAQWSPAWVMDSSGPAGALKTDLADAGIEPHEISGREVAQACGNFFKAATAPERDQLRHLGQPCLDEAIRAAKWRDIGDGGRAFGRRASDQDISPLMAVALALHGLAVYGADHYDVLASVF